ncbi:MAG TPA: hypothetical protein DCM07_29410, partial [Planctomycetaceae bacterium]|nr:hypothetical protein [Planctomycetaceae bacterium]
MGGKRVHAFFLIVSFDFVIKATKPFSVDIFLQLRRSHTTAHDLVKKFLRSYITRLNLAVSPVALLLQRSQKLEESLIGTASIVSLTDHVAVAIDGIDAKLFFQIVFNVSDIRHSFGGWQTSIIQGRGRRSLLGRERHLGISSILSIPTMIVGDSTCAAQAQRNCGWTSSNATSQPHQAGPDAHVGVHIIGLSFGHQWGA